MKAGRLSWFDKLIYFFNLLAVILLLCTYTAPYLNPETLWMPAILALGYPFTLALNMLFTIYWLLRKKWRQLLYMAAVLLLGLPMFTKTFAFATGQKTLVAGTPQLKVMSYNVRNFDLYNWKENVVARDKMLSLISAENPDVICFQEFYTEDAGELHNVKLLVNELGYKYYHFEKTLTLRGKDHWGEAVFSKYPLNNPDKIVFSNSTGNIVTYADVAVGEGQIIRLFNAHLQSFRLSNKDVKYVQDITGGLSQEDLKKSTIQKNLIVLLKLRDGFKKRSTQARILAEYIQKSPYPVLVCGDFNDVPSSYAYHTISKNLQDAFLQSSFGIGKTFNTFLPTLRIDYILAGEALHLSGFKIIDKDYSDHYAIVCNIGVPKNGVKP
ncbi:hypothetical protein C7N43_03070 [Sphingobacteriales bacterium UPWRP_1]|nr:hypothetical protein BVG80_09570 [Sphingobacteriales bacterium TSM_CSM]PSJ78599.1 hypothetical protein C7N43_03070 [Sphingobacteriales bacterium UPWRP_1]